MALTINGNPVPIRPTTLRRIPLGAPEPMFSGRIVSSRPGVAPFLRVLPIEVEGIAEGYSLADARALVTLLLSGDTLTVGGGAMMPGGGTIACYASGVEYELTPPLADGLFVQCELVEIDADA